MQERLERDAEKRHAAARATPDQWGVSPELELLETSGDVAARRDQRQRVIHAKRSDPFDLLHAAGGLNDWQHQAARRLMRDWCEWKGVQTTDRPEIGVRVDNPEGRCALDYQLDARKRVLKLLHDVGPVNARLLAGLIAPIVEQGAVISWRGTVQRMTGETERHAQGAVVRQACEALRLVLKIGPPPPANDDLAVEHAA